MLQISNCELNGFHSLELNTGEQNEKREFMRNVMTNHVLTVFSKVKNRKQKHYNIAFLVLHSYLKQ